MKTENEADKAVRETKSQTGGEGGSWETAPT